MRLLGIPRKKYLLLEQFNGMALNEAVWGVTDTESKLSVANGALVCAGGKAVPEWGNPQIQTVRTWPRVAGLTAEWDITPVNVNQFVVDFALDLTTRYGFYVPTGGGGTLQVYVGNTEVKNALAYSAGQRLLGRVVLKGTAGVLLYISTDGGRIWDLYWVGNVGGAGNFFLRYRNHSAAFSSSYCRVYRGSVKPPVIIADGDALSKYGIYDAQATVSAGEKGGVDACKLADATRYLRAYVNLVDNKLHLEKFEDPTTITLLNGAVTYSAAGQVRIVVVPGSGGLTNAQIAAYYAGTQVGTAQTVNLSSYGTLAARYKSAVGDTVTLEVNT